ncbi:MAG: hypothetical protein ACI9A2_003216 [Halioglobus sp.]|jgi:hypothetical protein
MALTTNSQQHKILRQVIEISGCAADTAQRMQPLLRKTYQQRLLPLIDSICSELSTPEHIHRIDRLEIELSQLPTDDLDSALAKPFAAAFREKLAGAIRDAPAVDADLELLDFFIRYGSLPWWVSKRAPKPLQTSLHRLVQNNPQALRRLLQSTSEPSQAWRRLARAYPDALLDQLVGLLAAKVWVGESMPASGIGIDWLALLQTIGLARGQSKVAIRHRFWEHTLAAASNFEQTAAAPEFYRAMLTPIAQYLGHDYPTLISALQRAVDASAKPFNPWVHQIISGLAQALNPEPAPERQSSDSSPDPAELMDILAQLQQATTPSAALWKQLHTLIERLPSGMKTQALALFDAASNSDTPIEPQPSVASSSAAQDTLLALLRTALQTTSADVKTRDSHTQNASQPHDAWRAELADLLTRFGQTATPSAALWKQLHTLIERLPSGIKTQALALFDAASNSDTPIEPQPSAALSSAAQEALLALLRTALQTTSADVKTRDSHTQNASQPHDAWRAELADLLTRFDQTATPSAALWKQLHTLIERLPAGSLRTQALNLFKQFSGPQRDLSTKVSPSAKNSLIALLRNTRAQLPKTKAKSKTDKLVSPVDSRFSETDALYIGNAGLVILWPFLSTFFQRLGLLEDQQFTDEAAQQRAVGLLQYLAGEDESPQETLLPLNKVLCGMKPEAVFNFGETISAREKEECDNLLAAAIQQASVLNNMSSAGFRGSFLRRQGQLSTRDDHWLLRVERETHDVVLDRFPWGLGIVKLPWMTAIMQVEW